MNKLRIGRWIVILASFAFALTPVGAQADNRAGLIIQYADGRTATHCVRFAELSISGLDLLARAGVPVQVEAGGLGTAVCSLGGEGCAYPAQPCFCQCQGGDCAYWNYLHLIDGKWRYSPIGAAGYSITDGAIDAWAWGDQVTPPMYTLDEICAAPAAPTVAPIATRPPATIAPTATSTQPGVEATVTSQPATMTSPLPLAPTQSVAPGATPPAATAAPSATLAAAEAPSPQSDASGYVVFVAAVVLLGGWLIVARLRKG